MPFNQEIKIIDFGCATLPKENHSGIINTRQYRAPEVIIGGKKWDCKSDIWCVACIFIELYTGVLLFSTSENAEHLAMIEKVAGIIPKEMLLNTTNKEITELLNLPELYAAKYKTMLNSRANRTNSCYPSIYISSNSIKINKIEDPDKRLKLENGINNLKTIDVRTNIIIFLGIDYKPKS